MAPISSACPSPLPPTVSIAGLDTNTWSTQTILTLVGIFVVLVMPCAALLLRVLYSKFKLWKARKETKEDEANPPGITTNVMGGQVTLIRDNGEEPAVTPTLVD
ncbi:hypothetical protein J1614_010456 [Plenodomus biglobosus]|nr:hypothetical protein J1614_010456 [Plenodomus biglobosus]